MIERFVLQDRNARDRYDELLHETSQAFIQQGTSWADAIRSLGPDEPIFLLASCNGRAVGGLPLYLFKGAAGRILTSVPQAGPLGGVFVREGESPSEIYQALLAEAVRMGTEYKCLSLSLITNPLCDDLHLYQEHLAPDFIFENFTQIVDLESVVRDRRWVLPDNSDRNPGRTVRKAQDSGLTCWLSDDPAEFAAWYAIHEGRHRELGLEPLSRKLLENLLMHLRPAGKAFLLLAGLGRQIVAGCLFVRHRDVADAFIMSMESAFRAHSPNYLVTRDALILLANDGVRYMNWQSSPGRDDGVYRFKKQWGSIERTYHFVTKLFVAPEQVLALGETAIRKHYPGHYVVPFGAFPAGLARGRYRKS